MANGRLGNCLIPPYSGAEIYSNTSGSSASISISAQVIDPSVDSEITTTVGTASTTLSAINNLTTTGCYCRLVGYHLDSNGYYGAFTASTTAPSCPNVNRYIASNETCTVGFSTSDTSCIAFGGSETVNPLLRYSTTSVASPECCPGMSAVIGFVPAVCCTCVSGWYILNKFTVTSQNCAATTFVNPCCNSRWSSLCGAICLAAGLCGATNYYALDSISDGGGFGCYCFCTSCCNSAFINNDSQRLSFGIICGCTCSTSIICAQVTNGVCYYNCTCSNCNSPIQCFPGYNVTGPSCNCTCLWYFNSSGCKISPYGVQSAATCGVYIHEHYFRDPVRYLITPTNGCFLCNCLNCFGYAVDTFICPSGSSGCELPVKYLSYNPNTKCVYMLVRSQNPDECGIFSVSVSTLCNCYSTTRTTTLSSSNVYCVTLQCSPLFCKLASFPTIMTCSYYTNPLMCVSCIFRSGTSTWSMSIYNCNTTAWDTFVTSNLIDWESATTSLNYLENETSIVKNAINCVYRQCNCFMSNIDTSGILDYEVSANNYERTGVVISNGDRVMVNNNSNKCLSVQVWGYEG
jgi:hypothetical protein